MNPSFEQFSTIVSELTARSPDPGLPPAMRYQGLEIPIEIRHLGTNAGRSRITLFPTSVVILNADCESIAKLLKDERSIYFIACLSYASYLAYGPLGYRAMEAFTEHLLTQIEWDEPELNPDGSIKTLSAQMPEDVGLERN